MIDRRIDLDEIVERPAMQVAAARRDDAGGDRGADTERIAYRQHLVAGHQLVGIAPFDGRQRLARLDLEHRQIVLGVVADELGGKFGAVVERYLDRGRAVDDVVVGDDGAVRADDEAGAQSLLPRRQLLRRRLRHRDALVAEELLEILVKGRTAVEG